MSDDWDTSDSADAFSASAPHDFRPDLFKSGVCSVCDRPRSDELHGIARPKDMSSWIDSLDTSDSPAAAAADAVLTPKPQEAPSESSADPTSPHDFVENPSRLAVCSVCDKPKSNAIHTNAVQRPRGPSVKAASSPLRRPSASAADTSSSATPSWAQRNATEEEEPAPRRPSEVAKQNGASAPATSAQSTPVRRPSFTGGAHDFQPHEVKMGVCAVCDKPKSNAIHGEPQDKPLSRKPSVTWVPAPSSSSSSNATDASIERRTSSAGASSSAADRRPSAGAATLERRPSTIAHDFVPHAVKMGVCATCERPRTNPVHGAPADTGAPAVFRRTSSASTIGKPAQTATPTAAATSASSAAAPQPTPTTPERRASESYPQHEFKAHEVKMGVCAVCDKPKSNSVHGEQSTPAFGRARAPSVKWITPPAAISEEEKPASTPAPAASAPSPAASAPSSSSASSASSTHKFEQHPTKLGTCAVCDKPKTNPLHPREEKPAETSAPAPALQRRAASASTLPVAPPAATTTTTAAKPNIAPKPSVTPGKRMSLPGSSATPAAAPASATPLKPVSEAKAAPSSNVDAKSSHDFVPHEVKMGVCGVCDKPKSNALHGSASTQRPRAPSVNWITPPK